MVFPRKSKRVLFRSIPMVLPTIGDLMMILSWWISLERESSAFNLFIESIECVVLCLTQTLIQITRWRFTVWKKIVSHITVESGSLFLMIAQR